MAVNKGLKSLIESTPNFSNQGLENAVNDIKAVDKDDGYQFIKSQFDVDKAIHNNTVLSQTQKNDALETLYNAQPHLQIGRYLQDVVRHTNTILDGSIIPGDSTITGTPDDQGQGSFLEILQLVQSLQNLIPNLFGVSASEKARDVNDHLGSLNNIFLETEDSTKPVFTRLKEKMQLIDTTARVNSTLSTGTAAVRYSNTQLVTFLTTIRDDSTDFQTTLDNRVNQAAGNMASLNTRINDALQGDPIGELQAIREEILTQMNLENSNITSLRSYTETLSDNEAYTSLADDPDLRKLMARTAQDTNWQNYFNDYEKNFDQLNPIYTTDADSDKASVIDAVLESRGLPDVLDHNDLDAVAEKAKKDDRIDTKGFDFLFVEQIIAKCCLQLGISTRGTVTNQSQRLLNNLNQRDRDLVSLELDENESANTIS